MDAGTDAFLAPKLVPQVATPYNRHEQEKEVHLAPPYIPPTSSGLDAFASNFSGLISAAPATYGLTAGDATTIAAAVALFHASYLLAGTTPPHNTPVNPSARTPVTVADMRSQMGAMVPVIRTYASQIRLDPGVTNAAKLALGLTLPNTTPAPIPAPTSFPLLSLLLATPLAHQFNYKDSLSPVGKAKAPGAIQMQLVGVAQATAPPGPDALGPLPSQTKSPFQIVWPSGASGLLASYFSRWVTRTGLVGPWSPITSAIVM
jgi:hypothetical protein